MISEDKRIRIITGHYGSGKTEFAVNYVKRLREISNKRVAIADLDVVNPYFRSREKETELNAMNIEVFSSELKGNSMDLPAVSPTVMGPMSNHSFDYVIDLGGDHVGARALARFSHLIDEDDYDMFFVLNANREQTSTAEGVIEHIRKIEIISKIKVTGLINNTHLVRESTKEEVLKGQELAKEVSKLTNIPIRYVSCLREISKELPKDIQGEIFPIDMQMRETWM